MQSPAGVRGPAWEQAQQTAVGSVGKGLCRRERGSARRGGALPPGERLCPRASLLRLRLCGEAPHCYLCWRAGPWGPGRGSASRQDLAGKRSVQGGLGGASGPALVEAGVPVREAWSSSADSEAVGTWVRPHSGRGCPRPHQASPFEALTCGPAEDCQAPGGSSVAGVPWRGTGPREAEEWTSGGRTRPAWPSLCPEGA